jgi:hypothetical protein
MTKKSKQEIKYIKERIRKTEKTDRATPEYKVPEKKPAAEVAELRPQKLVPRKINTIVAWIIFAIALIVYLLTQARSLSFWDSGEYATCISILGVPHPPGNPFYILFGRALVSLFGSFVPHAQIAAFISVLTSAFAVMFTYLITVQLTSMFRIKYWEAIFGGVIAALFTAFSFTFWMNAIEAEVYSGLVFFVNLIIWLTLYWVQRSKDFNRQNILLLIVYLFFLGFCVHQTALQIAPAILFIVVYPLLLGSVRKGNFWGKFIGYGAALIISYLIFGAIGRSLNIDAFDQMGFALCILVLMVIELKDVFDKRIWYISAALIVIGISSHIYLPIRAADRPFINLADPSTSERFDDYIQRRQYKPEQETSMFNRRGNLITHQLGYHFLRYFGWQWFNADRINSWVNINKGLIKGLGGLLVLFLGLFGAVFHHRKNRHSFNYFLAIMICTTILMVFVMNLSSSEVRDRDYFYVVAYNMWGIWMGIGALGLLHFFKDRTGRIVLATILLLLPILNMASQYYVHDRSREFIALDYGVNFLNTLEENAIIFTNGDNDTYPIWYAQAVEDPHASEYLHPARDVFPTPESEAAIQTAMQYKNSQLKGIRKDVTVANLSLLNTGWYIRQLRDKEGVIINLSEEEIDSLDDRTGLFQEYLWEDAVTYDAGDPAGEMRFTVNYYENYQNRETEGGFYPRRGSDFSVIQIVKDNFGKRPIYFAVTCESNIGFDDYLRNEGMAGRLVHTYSGGPGNQQIDIERLTTNIDEVYQYRSIFDNRVHKDDNMNRLVMNYGSGYTRAAIYYTKQGDFAKAEEYASQARKFIDSELRMTEYYLRYYAGQGMWDKVDQFIEVNIWPHSDAVRIYNSYVLNILAQDHPGHFARYMGKLLLRYPNEIDYSTLAFYYAENYGLQNEVEAMIDSLQGKLGYTWEDIYRYMYGSMTQEPPPQDNPGM